MGYLLFHFFLVSMSLISADVDYTNLSKDENCRSRKQSIKNPLIGQTVPQCNKDGNYNARQCSGSIGSCWCVDKLTGQEIEYLHVDKNGLPLCEPNCFMELEKVASILVLGEPVPLSNYVPNCDARTGYFLPKQCLVDKKECWCVSKLGKEIKNTRSTETISCPG